VAKIAQGLNGKVIEKKLILPIKSWIFTFSPKNKFAHGFECKNK
jgi:hypothetical protein